MQLTFELSSKRTEQRSCSQHGGLPGVWFGFDGVCCLSEASGLVRSGAAELVNPEAVRAAFDLPPVKVGGGGSLYPVGQSGAMSSDQSRPSGIAPVRMAPVLSRVERVQLEALLRAWDERGLAQAFAVLVGIEALVRRGGEPVERLRAALESLDVTSPARSA